MRQAKVQENWRDGAVRLLRNSPCLQVLARLEIANCICHSNRAAVRTPLKSLRLDDEEADEKCPNGHRQRDGEPGADRQGLPG